MSQFKVDDDDTIPVSPTYKGFHKFRRNPLDDVPPIKPPKRHMLSRVTGGLTVLYEYIKDEKDFKQKYSKDDPERDRLEQERIKCLRRANADLDFDEEDSPYTDEEGEFRPKENIPLLAGRYKFVEVLGKGQSALIVKALDTFSNESPVAIKVLHRIYKPIGSQEADILLELHRADPWLHVPFARLLNQFIYGPHYCLVFEFLSPTPLNNHYEQHKIKGIKSLVHVRSLCVKLLTVIGFLHKQNCIHADLKPENILLIDENDMASVMVIDFGNALRNTEEELSLYYSDFELQTLLYRAPEVIFGLEFSLQIDMWSLGCLLAECYTGEPLFMGKTKDDILAKITELLGPFPTLFLKGECADVFSEFIGNPLSRCKRIENLKKRLDNCEDINFLLLLEKLLTYIPEQRITPFEAACHQFVASCNPFLYLSGNQEPKKYPTVILDSTTYPFVPELPKKDEDTKLLQSRERLAAYTSVPPVIKGHKKDKLKELKEINAINAKVEVKKNVKLNKSSTPIHSPEPTPKKQDPPPKIPPKITPKIQQKVEKPKVTKESKEESKQKKSAEESKQKKSAEESPVMSPTDSAPPGSPTPSDSSEPSTNHVQYVVERKSDLPVAIDDLLQQAKLSHLQEKMQESNFSRTDVKHTLKSMGLRCEDFTISVYSKEQAHAILRKQGVEVTNHGPPAPPTKSNSKGNPRQIKGISGIRPSVSVLRSEGSSANSKPLGPPAPPPPKKPPVPEDDDDDDDDCVILDPPEGSAPPKMSSTSLAASRRYPQQFQLMGTTVQVNRGSKRPMRSLPRFAPMAKRPNKHPQYMYNKDRFYDEPSETTSVQDTLKRLKNYNISITCRRNSSSSTKNSKLDSDDEETEPKKHTESEDEEDMAKYLECEIDEERENMENSGEDPLDTSGSVAEADISTEEISPFKVPNKNKENLNSTVDLGDESKDGQEFNAQNGANKEIPEKEDVKSKMSPSDNNSSNERKSVSPPIENNEKIEPIKSPVNNTNKENELVDPLLDLNKSCLNENHTKETPPSSEPKDGNLEDEINEELENELLGSTEDARMEDEGLDNIELENEL